VNVDDVKVSQATHVTPHPAYEDRFITPEANSLWGFDSNKRPVKVSIGANITLVGNILSATGGGGGSGTVTNFSAGNLSPLFSTSVATSTTTPALTFSLTNQAQKTFLAGPTSGADTAPTFRTIGSTDLPDLSSIYQPLNTKLSAFSALANSIGWLHNDGAGVLSYSTPTYSDVGAAPSSTVSFPGFGTSGSTACVGNDARLSDARPASDVYAWAKAPTKPSYTYTEVGADPAGAAAAITLAGLGGVPTTRQVNGHALSSDVTVTKSDVGLGNVANSLQLVAASNLSDIANAGTARGNLGGTTVGQNLFTLANPSAITFPRINADNTVSTLDASSFRTAIGAGTSSFDGTWGSLSGKPANVVSFGSLANASGWLHNDGAGVLSYSTPTKSDVGLSAVENTALSTWAGSTNLTTLGTIATGTWNASVIAGQYGGTGVANTGKTITLGGNLTTSGAFATTLTATAATSITLPTTGTLATLAGAESLTNKKLGSLTTNGFITTTSSDGTLVVTNAAAFTSGTLAGLTGLAIRDTSAAFDLTFAATSSTALMAGRTLTFDVVNAARTIKLTGNPTLADWFDQSVKSTASPSFSNLTANGNFRLTSYSAGALYENDTGDVLSEAALNVIRGGTGLTTIAASKLLWSTASNTLGAISLGYGMTVTSSELRTPQDLRTTGAPTFTGVTIDSRGIGYATLTLNADVTNNSAGLLLESNNVQEWSLISHIGGVDAFGLYNINLTANAFSVNRSNNQISFGTIAAGTWSGTAIGVTNGGTGLTGLASGKMLYASASNTLAALSTGNSLAITGGILDTIQDIRTSAAPNFKALFCSDNKPSAYNLVSVVNTGTGGGSQIVLNAQSADGTINWAPANFFRFFNGTSVPYEFVYASGVTALSISSSGAITTASPSGGTAQPWKLGGYTSGIAVQAGRVRVEINGIPYDLLTA
jgi:hypothetical protein